MNQKPFTLLALALIASGCVARYDYHGVDPKAYNEVLYPKVNKVEFNSIYQSFYFNSQDDFTADSKAAFTQFTDRVYPSAVERLVIASAHKNPARDLYVTRQLRSLGFKKKIMEYKIDPDLAMDEVVVQLDYNYVITPDCPDWRKSSDLNYSNTNLSQMECATTTNLGRQMANPKHLVDSDSLRVIPNGNVDAQAITNYRAGGTAAGTSTSSASSGGSAGSEAAAPAAQ